MAYRIIIVEDELLIVEDLSAILVEAGYIIAGHAMNGSQALELIESTSADLVLLDVKLKGSMTGIDVARQINGTVPFLFLTSMKDVQSRDEIASLAAGGYLVKPFVEEELLVNVRLALERRRSNNAKTKPSASGFMIRDGTVLKKVQPQTIAYARGEDNYTRISLIDGKEHLISHTLKAVEAKLTELDVFCRVHKSYVINLDHVRGIEGQNLLIMNKIIPIGKSYRSSLLQRFDVL
ncbi:MAG: response regulator transcription factor [Cyclobacteriaceae bacterium]